MSVLQWLATAGAGVVFGLALAAPPGPMNAVIAEESVRGGWRSGFVAGLGAMVADACFLGLSLVGVVAVVQRSPTLRAAMIGIGGLLLWYFAYDAVTDLRSTYAADAAVPGPRSNSRGFVRAFALAITNPYQILFWLTVGVGLLEPGRVDVLAKTPYVGASLSELLVVETGSPLLISGLFGGIACWIVGFPAALVRARDRTDRIAPIVAGLSAVAFAGFGLVFLVDAARTLL